MSNCNLLDMKTCSRCKVPKEASLDNFYPYKRSSDGLNSWCKQCFSDHRKQTYKKHSDAILLRNKNWKSRNKEKVLRYTNEYIQKRYKEDILFRLACRLRDRTRSAIRGASFEKKQSVSKYLGCSIEDLKKHIECQFQPGMTWENYGKWHIDHRRPLSVATSVEELYALCHYANLQPLWAEENLIKGAKVS